VTTKPLSKRLQGHTLVSFACNDYRNGSAKGYFEQIECVGLQLDSPWHGRYLKCEATERHVVVGARRWWRTGGIVPWYGNWCWDAVWMTWKDAAELLTFVRGKGYRPDSGPDFLWDKQAYFATDLIDASMETI
jgi:hypothetical protein